jgi:aminomethyltransferase
MLSTAPQPSLIYRPGIRILAPGVERYRVLGAGSTVVSVKAGDVIDLIDIEGGQSCEITFCDESGRFDCLALGACANGRGEGLKALLAEDTECTQRTKSTLQRRNIDLGQAETLRLFGAESLSGARAELKVSRDGILIVAAPGAAMAPENQDTATDIELRITRSGRAADRSDLLPEPLADPLQDIRIRAATATAYLVRAGEYIQVIDVSGRQCTDFQALSARKVDKGLDLALDSTITRTLLAAAIPRQACHQNPLTGNSNRLSKSCAIRLGGTMPSPRPAIPAITTTWAIRAM